MFHYRVGFRGRAAWAPPHLRPASRGMVGWGGFSLPRRKVKKKKLNALKMNHYWVKSEKKKLRGAPPPYTPPPWSSLKLTPQPRILTLSAPGHISLKPVPVYTPHFVYHILYRGGVDICIYYSGPSPPPHPFGAGTPCD